MVVWKVICHWWSSGYGDGEESNEVLIGEFMTEELANNARDRLKNYLDELLTVTDSQTKVWIQVLSESVWTKTDHLTDDWFRQIFTGRYFY